MDEFQSCNHLYCKLKLKYSRFSKLAIMLAVSLIVFVAVFGYYIYSRTAEESIVKDQALIFAKVLRQAEEQARQYRSVLSVTLRLLESEKSYAYCIRDGEKILSTHKLTDGISGFGAVKLDPEGTPLAPALFTFRKGTHSVNVAMDSKGAITFPE